MQVRFKVRARSHAETLRGTSLERKRNPVGPYCRPMPRIPRVLGGGFLGWCAISYERGTSVRVKLILAISAMAAVERRGDNLNDFNDFNLRATARIWPWLSYLFQVRSTAVNQKHAKCYLTN